MRLVVEELFIVEIENLQRFEKFAANFGNVGRFRSPVFDLSEQKDQ
jgi:hypothetical protein